MDEGIARENERPHSENGVETGIGEGCIRYRPFNATHRLHPKHPKKQKGKEEWQPCCDEAGHEEGLGAAGETKAEQHPTRPRAHQCQPKHSDERGQALQASAEGEAVVQEESA